VGLGTPPDGARTLDEHHPAQEAFAALGGEGPIWLKSPIPMARGLGFSGAVRVAAGALGAVSVGRGVDEARSEVLEVATRLEGHGDNAAASVFGGVVAHLGDDVLPLRIGPHLASAAVVAWVPDSTTSTERSRNALPMDVRRPDAVFNLGRVIQFTLAVDRDEPALLAGATDDRLHQEARLSLIDGAAEALRCGTDAGAWCAWLSGSGPTVAFLCDPGVAGHVAAAMPGGGHVKELSLDTTGVRQI
jgi:homoserine kinase